MARRRSLAEAIPPRPPPDEPGIDARERILRTAYELFSHNGLVCIGVDRIVAEGNVAKTTLYRHFPSKDALVVATLARHGDLWTRGWLEPEAKRRATPSLPAVLALFDALDDWFRQECYEGCFFLNALLETHDRSSPVREAAMRGIGEIHALVRRLAEEAGVREPNEFAHQIQLLVRGAIVAAVDRHFEAVEQARALARSLLDRETPKV